MYAKGASRNPEAFDLTKRVTSRVYFGHRENAAHFWCCLIFPKSIVLSAANNMLRAAVRHRQHCISTSSRRQLRTSNPPAGPCTGYGPGAVSNRLYSSTVGLELAYNNGVSPGTISTDTGRVKNSVTVVSVYDDHNPLLAELG